MRSLDTNKKERSYRRILSAAVAAIVAAAALLLLSCGRVITDTVWVDMLEPEEPDVVAVTSPAVKLPEKPAVPPTTDKTKPSAFGTVTASDACYTVEAGANGAFTVSYGSDEPLPAYAYAYVPVTNYDGNAYLKIKANCESVERLAVLAVYYEQYEQARPAVTVYNSSVMDGENIIICELENGVLLDGAYGAVMGEKLTQKSICGFMLMIDSNPKQVIDEYTGKFAVTEIVVTDENDPDLDKLYAAPYISVWKDGGGFDKCDITTSRSQTADCLDAEMVYSVSSANYARAEATIANYKPEYTTVKMDIKGANVQTLTVAIKYTIKSSSENIDYNYLSSFDMPVNADWESYEFDFSTLEELKAFQNNVTVPGSYVKNLKPSALYFFVDGGKNNSGTLSVRNVTFEKAAEGSAPRITSTWALGAGGITKSNVAEGGIGTLNYDKRQGWNPVTVNVSSYDTEYTSLVVRVKFYNSYSNLGIALGYGSSNTVILQSAGMNVPDGFDVKLVAHTQDSGSDEGGEYTFHTFEIDFSNAKTTKGGSELLAEQPITKIMLYIDAVAQNSSGAWIEPSAGNPLNPARQMQFVGMEFKKPNK